MCNLYYNCLPFTGKPMKIFQQKINIDESVKFQLTEYGMQIYMEFLAEKLKGTSLKPTKPKKDKQGYITLPLHRLINIFGEKLTPVEGAEIFVNNEIIYETSLIAIEHEIEQIRFNEEEENQKKLYAEYTKFTKGEKVVMNYGGISDILTYLNQYGEKTHTVQFPNGSPYDVPIWSLRYPTQEELDANTRLD